MILMKEAGDRKIRCLPSSKANFFLSRLKILLIQLRTLRELYYNLKFVSPNSNRLERKSKRILLVLSLKIDSAQLLLLREHLSLQ